MVYDSASAASKKWIDSIQNLALRNVTYMPQSTSVEALEGILGIPPLEMRRKELRLAAAFKVRQEEDHPMREAFIVSNIGPWEIDLEEEKYPIGWKTEKQISADPGLMKVFSKITAHREIMPSWVCNKPKTDIGLLKHDNLTREIASEYIQAVGKGALKVYTDGSKDQTGRLGIGIFIPAWQICKNYAITEDASIFTAEMIAVLKALEIVTENPPDKVLILTDSLSTIQGLDSEEDCSRPDITSEILQATTCLNHNGCAVMLAWIPAHIGIRGNERADREANKGRKTKCKIDTGLGKTEAKSGIKKILKEQWRTKWINSGKGRSAYQHFDLPSRKCQISNILKIPTNQKILKMQVGRGNFLLDEEPCEECQVVFDIQHVFECSLFAEERMELQQYCDDRNMQMTKENLLNNKLEKAEQSMLKQYISRIPLDI
jgi:ribonuclease HI